MFPSGIFERKLLKRVIILEFIVSIKYPTEFDYDQWIKDRMQENRICACGCNQAIQVNKSHFWHGIPKFIHGHSNFKAFNYFTMTKTRLNVKTIQDVCKLLKIGQTTFRRYEGRIFPKSKRMSNIRIFTQEDIDEILRIWKKAKKKLKGLHH